jgi:hypothetical protein
MIKRIEKRGIKRRGEEVEVRKGDKIEMEIRRIVNSLRKIQNNREAKKYRQQKIF